MFYEIREPACSPVAMTSRVDLWTSLGRDVLLTFLLASPLGEVFQRRNPLVELKRRFIFSKMELPSIIELVGFPLPGNERWTNRFIKSDDATYLLVRSQPTEIEIRKVIGIWRLVGDRQTHVPIIKIDDDQRSPVGEWTDGAQVYSV